MSADFTDPAPDGELDRLVGECIERWPRDGEAALDELCRDHPEHAEALRSAVEVLRDHGVTGAGAAGADPPPRRLAEFELLREIGRGGMGVVYEAIDRDLDRRVAVKVLLPHLTHDSRTVERFRREGRTVGALHHPGIVQVHRVGSAAGHDYIVMEFVAGAPLDTILNAVREGGHARPVDLAAIVDALRHRSERASEAVAEPGRSFGEDYVGTVVGWVASVADALHAAHRAGVIHRDIKPSNILVRADGTPVLTDFGLAQREDQPGLTRSGALAGTPAYMAPEQTTSGDPIDARTDVFCLGSTLFELLTLQRPFAGDSSHEMMRNIQTLDPADPRRLDRRLAPDLAAIVLKALEKEPGRRYQSAAAFAADLRAFLHNLPVVARRATLFEQVRRWTVRQPLRAALVVVLALGIPTIAALIAYQVANEPLVTAAQEQRRRDRVEKALNDAYMLGYGNARHEAIARLDEALAIDPDNVEAIASKAFHLLMPVGLGAEPTVEDAAAALDLLEACPESMLDTRVLARMRAWSLLGVGRAEEGEAELARLGDPTGTLESFWSGVRLLTPHMSPDYSPQRRQAHHLLEQAALSSVRARPAFHYYLAAAAGFTEDRAAAERVAAALSHLWPDSATAWRGIGMALYRMDPERSIDAYRRALAIEDEAATRNNLANALAQHGDFEAAAGEYRTLLEQRPDYVQGHFNLAQLLFARLNRPDEAMVHLEEVLRLDPTDVGARHYQIWVLSQRGDVAQAIASARQGIESTPTASVLHRDLARAIYFGNGDFEGALAVLRAAVEQLPEPDNFKALASMLADGGRMDEAVRAWERAVETAGHDEDRQTMEEEFAIFLLGIGQDTPPIDAARALVIAERLVDETARTNPWYLELLAEALRLQGYPDRALPVFEESLARAGDVKTASRTNLAARVEQKLKDLRAQLAGR